MEVRRCSHCRIWNWREDGCRFVSIFFSSVPLAKCKHIETTWTRQAQTSGKMICTLAQAYYFILSFDNWHCMTWSFYCGFYGRRNFSFTSTPISAKRLNSSGSFVFNACRIESPFYPFDVRKYTSTSTSLYHRLINIDHIEKVIAKVFIFPFSRHFYFSMSRVWKQFLQFMNEKAQDVFDFGCCCHRHRFLSRNDCLARRWQLLQSYQFWRRRYKLSSQKLRFFRNRRPTFRQLIWTPEYEVIFTTFSETKHYKEPEGDSVKRLLSSSSMSGTFEAFIGL